MINYILTAHCREWNKLYTSKEGGVPWNLGIYSLDGAKSVEISALLTYVNYTKFMNLPTSTLQGIVVNPWEIANYYKFSGNNC